MQITQVDLQGTPLSMQHTAPRDGVLSEFKAVLDTISQTQQHAQRQTEAFQFGDPAVSLNEVMVNLQKSSVSLQFGLQCTTKLINAYKEIMNMPV